MQTPFQPTSTAPAPGTSSTGDSWVDFVNGTVRGIAAVFNGGRVVGTAPAQTGGGWGGTTLPTPNQTAPTSDPLLLLGVILLIVFLVSE